MSLHALRRNLANLLPPKYFPSLYISAALDGHCLQEIGSLVDEEVSEGINTILCVGHNKGWEEAAEILSGRNVRLDNSSAALLQAEAQGGESWKDLLDEVSGAGRWQLVDVLNP